MRVQYGEEYVSAIFFSLSWILQLPEFLFPWVKHFKNAKDHLVTLTHNSRLHPVLPVYHVSEEPIDIILKPQIFQVSSLLLKF